MNSAPQNLKLTPTMLEFLRDALDENVGIRLDKEGSGIAKSKPGKGMDSIRVEQWNPEEECYWRGYQSRTVEALEERGLITTELTGSFRTLAKRFDIVPDRITSIKAAVSEYEAKNLYRLSWDDIVRIQGGTYSDADYPDNAVIGFLLDSIVDNSTYAGGNVLYVSWTMDKDTFVQAMALLRAWGFRVVENPHQLNWEDFEIYPSNHTTKSPINGARGKIQKFLEESFHGDLFSAIGQEIGWYRKGDRLVSIENEMVSFHVDQVSPLHGLNILWTGTETPQGQTYSLIDIFNDNLVYNCITRAPYLLIESDENWIYLSPTNLLLPKILPRSRYENLYRDGLIHARPASEVEIRDYLDNYEGFEAWQVSQALVIEPTITVEGGYGSY